MGQFTGPLYAWADKSLRERTALYRNQEDTKFCRDEMAATFERVLWLKDQNVEQPFRHVLEVGCHDGFVTRWLAESEEMERVYGIDPCKVAIDLALEHAPDPRFRYEEAGFEETAFARIFDTLVCFEVLEHFLPGEVQALLEWMLAHATPSARMYFCTPNKHGYFGEENNDPCHVQLFTEDALEEALASGLPEGQIEKHLCFPECIHLMMMVTMPEAVLV